MSKSKRLMELMMTVNRMRKFTVRELADQFDVSSRTILRDLQELSELGVPLYSEVGPHGGYQVLKERILPDRLQRGRSRCDVFCQPRPASLSISSL